MRAGLHSYPGNDITGTQVTNYKNMGRVYAIAEKGTFIHLISVISHNNIIIPICHLKIPILICEIVKIKLDCGAPSLVGQLF